MIYVLIFSTTSVWDISHSEKSSAAYCKCTLLFIVKYPLFLSDFNGTWIFSRDFQ